jgi:N-methylhydantoinase B
VERQHLAGPGFESAIGLQVWSWVDRDGSPDAYIVLDGNWVGGSAGINRDGLDLGRNLIGNRIERSFPDIEILESWYPLLFSERSARSGPEGAGEYRAGGGNQLSFRPHGIDEMSGTTFGMRRWLPLPGTAGGAPGACNEFLAHRADGSVEQLEINASGIEIGPGDWFQMRLPTGGGFGDPLDREPDAVVADVEDGRYSMEDADRTYGVILTEEGKSNDPATRRKRAELRSQRLSSARRAHRPITEVDVAGLAAGDPVPIYPGVVQRGSVAYAEASGAPLAVAPDHWTDGCPVHIERRWPDGPPVVYRTYLDPRSGRSLFVEVALEGEPRSFEMSPQRWIAAAPARIG